jgi:hypothetical protein
LTTKATCKISFSAHFEFEEGSLLFGGSMDGELLKTIDLFCSLHSLSYMPDSDLGGDDNRFELWLQGIWKSREEEWNKSESNIAAAHGGCPRIPEHPGGP